MFFVFSQSHSSDVSFVLNLRTGHISPQFHLVFDDTFSTVLSQSQQDDPPDWWNVVDLEENILQIPLDQYSHLHPENNWLTPAELEEISRNYIRLNQLCKSFDQGSVPTASPSAPLQIENEINVPLLSDENNMANPTVSTEMNSSALPPTQPLSSPIKKSPMAPSLPPLAPSPIVPSSPSP